MNTKSLVKLVAIGLVLGTIIMCLLYIAATLPTSSAQAQAAQYNTVSLTKERIKS